MKLQHVILLIVFVIFSCSSKLQPQNNFYVVTSRNGLNLRKNPEVKGGIIKAIPYKSIVISLNKSYKEKLLKKTRTWLKIQWKNKSGWVVKKYLKTKFINIVGKTFNNVRTQTDHIEIIYFPKKNVVYKYWNGINSYGFKKGRYKRSLNILIIKYNNFAISTRPLDMQKKEIIKKKIKEIRKFKISYYYDKLQKKNVIGIEPLIKDPKWKTRPWYNRKFNLKLFTKEINTLK